LVTPNGDEDIVQLDVDGGEGEEASDEELDRESGVPLRSRDLTDGELGLGGRIEVTSVALTSDGTGKSEGEGNQEIHGEESYDGAEGKSSSGFVHDGDGVEEGPDDEERTDEESDTDQDVVNPVLAAELLVPHTTGEASEKSSQGVDDDEGGVSSTTTIRIEGTNNSKSEHADKDEENLNTTSKNGTEEFEVRREAEDITMKTLPSRFLIARFFFKLSQTLEVTIEHAKNNKDAETSQENNENTSVDDGEPLNIKFSSVDFSGVVGRSIFEFNLSLFPVSGVGKGNLDAGGGVAGSRELDTTGGIRIDGSFNNAINVVRKLEVESSVEEHVTVGAVFTDVTTELNTIIVHCEVVFVLDGVTELLDIFRLESLNAKNFELSVSAETNVIIAVNLAAALEDFTKSLGFVFDGFGRLAVVEGVVTIRFSGIIFGNDVVYEERNFLLHCVSLIFMS